MEIYFAEPKDISVQAKRISDTLLSTTEELVNKRIESISSKAASNMGGNSTLIIAIGPDALSEVLSGSGLAPVVGVFISKLSFESVLNTNATKSTREISAIYSDPSPFRQVALTRALYGPGHTSVIIGSQFSQMYINDFSQAAITVGINLKVIDLANISSTSDFIAETNTASSILLLKDKSLFDKISLEKILLSSYDFNHQGVIGYSKGLVNSGAAATTYSSLSDIAMSINDQSNKLEAEELLIKPSYTNTFQVALNKYILRSLDVVNISEKEIHSEVSDLILKGGIE